MSEQPSIDYEPAPTPFTEETDVLLNAGDPRLSSVAAARALVEATKQRHLERIQTPETPYQQMAQISKLVLRYRKDGFDLAA